MDRRSLLKTAILVPLVGVPAKQRRSSSIDRLLAYARYSQLPMDVLKSFIILGVLDNGDIVRLPPLRNVTLDREPFVLCFYCEPVMLDCDMNVVEYRLVDEEGKSSISGKMDMKAKRGDKVTYTLTLRAT